MTDRAFSSLHEAAALTPNLHSTDATVPRSRTAPTRNVGELPKTPAWIAEIDELRQTTYSPLRRRLRYIARFVLWTLRHRSTRNVRWVLAHEGTTWN